MIVPTTEVFAPLPLPPHHTAPLTQKLQHEVADLEANVRRTTQNIQQTTEAARQAELFAEQQRQLAENGMHIMTEMPRNDGLYVVHGKVGEVDSIGAQVAGQEQGAGVAKEGIQLGSAPAANATGQSMRPKVDRFTKTSEVYRTKSELPRRFNEPGIAWTYRCMAGGKPCIQLFYRISMSGIWTHQTTHQHPLYTTTASQYGQYQPTVHEMPTTFHGQSARFSEVKVKNSVLPNSYFIEIVYLKYLNQAGPYRNHSLNTK